MILIGLGSSLPFSGLDSQDVVIKAAQAIGQLGRNLQLSSLYHSPAWPDPSDPPFVNAVARFETAMVPEALLAALHSIEAGFGRRRGVLNGPRTLDLDLLAYDDERRSDGGTGLVLPHPRMASRDFVLVPLCEIAPDWRDPVSGQTAKMLLEAIETGEIRRIS